jgi:hypothetical protein
MRPTSRQALVDSYLAARRSVGFDLRIAGRQLRTFARFADQTGHWDPLTVDVAVRWAQSAWRGTRLTWARRLQTLRPFMKYRSQFDPRTEIPPAGLFGPAHRRLVPHIYTDGGHGVSPCRGAAPAGHGAAAARPHVRHVVRIAREHRGADFRAPKRIEQGGHQLSVARKDGDPFGEGDSS